MPQGEFVIALDLAALSPEELQKAIEERCFSYGSVSRVTAVESEPGVAMAWVEMASASEAQEVAKHLGDLKPIW